MKTDFDEFKSYYKLGEQLIDSMTKEQVANTSCSLHLGGYQIRFGQNSDPRLPRATAWTEISDEQARLLG